MNTRERIEQDYISAMRDKNNHTVNVLRMLRAAISAAEKIRQNPSDKNHDRPLLDDEVISIIRREEKQKMESLDFAARANRIDLTMEYEYDLEVIRTYLPEQMTEDLVRIVVVEIMSELNTNEFKKVMPIVSQRLRGRADGKLVANIVKEHTVNGV